MTRAYGCIDPCQLAAKAIQNTVAIPAGPSVIVILRNQRGQLYHLGPYPPPPPPPQCNLSHEQRVWRRIGGGG